MAQQEERAAEWEAAAKAEEAGLAQRKKVRRRGVSSNVSLAGKSGEKRGWLCFHGSADAPGRHRGHRVVLAASWINILLAWLQCHID